MIDLVIPLGTGSKSGNDELKLFLRSIEKNGTIYNARGKDRFPADGSIWQRRVRRTFELLESRNLTLSHNYESHTPHHYPARKSDTTTPPFWADCGRRCSNSFRTNPVMNGDYFRF